MRAIDRATSERFGVPSLSLMERAGGAVAEVAARELPHAQFFMIVCGKGNNGGDGFVAARKLKESGKEVGVVLLAKADELRGDAAVMFKRMAMPYTSVTSSEALHGELLPALKRADVVIDAILGTGFRPPVKSLYAEAIEAINGGKAPVVSVDIPSGADSDSMLPQAGDAIARSDAIVTFTAPRPAHVFGQLTRGATVCAPIGSPGEAIVSELGLNLITPWDIGTLFGLRKPNGHKGLYGHVLVLGGSVGKAGAAAMAGISALRSGAGLVTVATAKSVLPMVAGFAFELMTEPLEETGVGTIAASEQGFATLDKIAEGKDVLAIGPGISRNPETELFVRAAVGRYKLPMVIDADGLNAFQGNANLLNGSGRALVLTPHPGEMSRLTGLSIEEIQQNRIGVSRKLAREHECIVVLKGNRTVVALPDETVWVNPTGNPGMASGGTGDVLTGMVAGMIGQNRDDIARAVIAAVYLHGLAGDVAREKMGEQALIAGDLIAAFPEAMRRVRERAENKFVEF